MNKLKIISSFMSLTIFLFFSFSCNNTVTEANDSDNESSETAQIRFIHSASSTSELDFAYRDLTDGNFYILTHETTYGHQYGYYDFLTGEREIRLYFSYSDIAVAGAKITLKNDKKYTVIAYDYEATINPELMVLNDTLAVPDSGMSYVRFIHTGIDVSPIQISEKDSSNFISELNRLDNSNYMEFQARTYYFKVISTQSKEIILEVDPITFLSGHSYSIIFSGSISDITTIDFNAKVYRESSI